MIREQSDIITEGSRGGLTGFSSGDRCAALQADIDMASLNPGSVDFDNGVYINWPPDTDYWVGEMYRRGAKPCVAIFLRRA
jgi:3-keto-5-aminohexanoate cleavage enzyme